MPLVAEQGWSILTSRVSKVDDIPVQVSEELSNEEETEGAAFQYLQQNSSQLKT